MVVSDKLQAYPNLLLLASAKLSFSPSVRRRSWCLPGHGEQVGKETWLQDLSVFRINNNHGIIVCYQQYLYYSLRKLLTKSADYLPFLGNT